MNSMGDEADHRLMPQQMHFDDEDDEDDDEDERRRRRIIRQCLGG